MSFWPFTVERRMYNVFCWFSMIFFQILSLSFVSVLYLMQALAKCFVYYEYLSRNIFCSLDSRWTALKRTAYSKLLSVLPQKTAIFWRKCCLYGSFTTRKNPTPKSLIPNHQASNLLVSVFFCSELLGTTQVRSLISPLCKVVLRIFVGIIQLARRLIPSVPSDLKRNLLGVL